jgi:hypothetical protein
MPPDCDDARLLARNGSARGQSMNRIRLSLAFLASAFTLALAPAARATHYRHGNITYTVDPNDPRVVTFDVTVAWRSTFIDGVARAARRAHALDVSGDPVHRRHRGRRRGPHHEQR